MKKLFLSSFFILLSSCATFSYQRTFFTSISEQDEYDLGRITCAKIIYSYPLIKNDSLTEYLTRMASYLALFSERPYIFKGYHVGVMNTDEPMAFSTPGGFILISKGLIKELDNEDQLAAVIAHEIGHVAKKHGLSYIKTSHLIDLTSKLAKKAVRKTIENERKRKIGEISVSITNILLKRGYSRKQETEADLEAVKILEKSGYNPYAIIEVLEKIKKYSENQIIQFTKTHPFPENRIKFLKPTLSSKKVSQKRLQRFFVYKSML